MEQTIIVCDRCSRPATTTVNLRFNGTTHDNTTYQVDLCKVHERDMKTSARKAKRGRRAGTYVGTVSRRPAKRETAPQ
jgi:hypothetical protein